MEPLYVVLAVIAVLLVVGGLWFALSARRRRREPPRIEAPAETAAEAEAARTTEAVEAAQEPGLIEAPPPPAEPRFERPESIPGRMQRLRARLAGAGGFGRAILAVLSRGDLTEADWEEIEDTLLTSDLGIEVTTSLMDELRTQAKVLDTSDPAAIRAVLRAQLLELVDPTMDRSLTLTRPEPAAGWEEADGAPAAAVLMVGVNGTGKTTTCGKLARVLLAEDRTVLMGAADTFRAAAAEQLTTWGERVGVEVVRSEREGADPASVAFDAARQAARTGVDVVVVDTAGRLQNKAGLMDELGKIKRVMEKIAPVGEVLLVLDATTGQNGMRQAQVFSQAVGITGIVLTKLDGTAKGGIVVTVQKELGVPVKLVGLGEGADDLAPFDPEGFVDALLS